MMNNILEINDDFKEIDDGYFNNYGGGEYSSTYQDYTTDPEYMIETLVDYNIFPKSILDVGCASGEFVKDLRNLGINAYGIEKNKKILEKCVAPKYCVQMDILDLGDLDEEKFGLIFTNSLMYFFPTQIPQILKDFHKISIEGVWLCNPYLEDIPFGDKYRKFLGSRIWWVGQFEKAGFEKLNDNLFKKV